MTKAKETRPGTAATVQDAQVHNRHINDTPSGASRQALAFEKMFAVIDSVDVGHYRLETDEALAIIDRANYEPFKTAVMAFRYGFIKGQRAEKARQRALRKREEAGE